MNLKLEVLLSSSIKRKKPWPRFCWLGMEKEGVFLLDDKRISEIILVSGHTKKKTPKLQPLLPRVLTMSASQNGVWLSGILTSGELFLWNRDKDSLKMISSVAAVSQLVAFAQETSMRLSLLVSGDGQRVLLVMLTGQVFLWECFRPQDLSSVRDTAVAGRWSQIESSGNTALPSSKNKETSHHSVFVKSQEVGDVCMNAFVFTSEDQLIVSFLKIQWEEGWERKLSSVGYSVHWVTKTYPLKCLSPPCRPVRSRGALVSAFSPDGLLLAVVLNQKDPRATQALFISTQNFVSLSSSLGGCGSKQLNIPPKYLRSYWVGCVSWTAGGLYLACVLKRGSLLLLARLGGLVTLSTTGCNIEFGPAHFLPLHPLITYRPPVASQQQDGALSSSSVSLRDALRQRYSVTWHPRLPYLIVSDGYMATMLRMPSHPSPTSLISAHLLDAAEGLERVRKALVNSEPRVRSRLESMSTLKFTASLQLLRQKEIPTATLPLCLQDERGSDDIREKLKKILVQDEDESDCSQCAGSRLEEGGRLEFASMFDTLHAHSDSQSDPEDPESEEPLTLRGDLEAVQRSLLTAWALGLSLGGVAEQRERLLKYAARCAVRLAALLGLCPPGSQSGKKKSGTRASNVFHLLKSLLSFLPWDAPHTRGGSCLGVAVDLIRQFVFLVLNPSSERPLSSQSLSAALLILHKASQSLNLTYRLPQKAVYGPPDLHQADACPSDVFSLPLLQEEGGTQLVISQEPGLETQLPSSRLLAVWQSVYTQAVHYQTELCQNGGYGSRAKELERVSEILSKIQRVLQRAGNRLEDSPALHSFAGEQHFILGSYGESTQIWRAELWAERERSGPRTCFLETRYCLALLYSHLFLYRLREAQGLCDYLARQLLPPAEQGEDIVEDALDEGWLPGQVNSEAARAVVQSLGRFMASYFTNQPLSILPPHNVDVLPPLHFPQTSGRRLVVLSQSRVAGAVRSQQLSEVWTVDYALELLLLGGLLPEAVWLAHRLGDWKMAASLSLAYTTYCKEHYDFSKLKWRELHLPTELQPGHIFQCQLKSCLGQMSPSDDDDSVNAEDTELLQVSVQEILKASVMAEVDVVSQPLRLLLDSAKQSASSLSPLVCPGLYLPTPPLYCPQPAPNTQDSTGDLSALTEEASRRGVSGALQRVLLLLRAAHCSRPAAEWYVRNLRHCQQLSHKIRQRFGEPKDAPFSEGLMKFAARCGFFRSGASGDGNIDAVTKQIITCFRELCGLCWMLHVRDRLTVSCRKYQAARNNRRDSQIRDEDLNELCVEALRWACRLLPFSRFLNAEEILQDLVLSLVSELPPIAMVAETLARVFVEEEESVRVPLREKYNSLLHRLRPCPVQNFTSLPDAQANGKTEAGEPETMLLLIQDELRRHRRELRRLGKHLAPVELHIWEREEDDDRGGVHFLERFSLGASLSNSTLTDCGRPQVYSEGDTAETLSEPLSPDLQTRPPHSPKKQQDRAERSAQREKEDQISPAAGPGGADRAQDSAGGTEGAKAPSLPAVGTWMFELEDEEYARFLELFLSYVLEKDKLDGEDSELPLSSGFSARLRERELHSPAFDVLTTLRRRQRDGRQAARRRGPRAPVFRAGRCFRSAPDTPEPPPSTVRAPSVQSDAQLRGNNVTLRHLSGLHGGKQQGLFGVRLQQGGSSPETGTVGDGRVSSQPSPSQSSIPWGAQTERWPFKTAALADTDLQQDLDPKLEARFPRLGRLLEWMVRWADRRAAHTQPARRKPEGPGGPDDAVVMRAKASTPAVLTALRLLEHRYTTALLAPDRPCTHLRVPERQYTVAPVLQPDTGWKVERESSVDTGYPGSAETPVTLPDLDHQHGPTPDTCDAEGVEEEQSVVYLSEEEEMTHHSGRKEGERKPASGGSERQPPAETNGDSSAVETWEVSASFSVPNISAQINSHSKTLSGPRGQALTLADLECPGTEENSSRSLSLAEKNESCSHTVDRPLLDSTETAPNEPEVSKQTSPLQPDLRSLPVPNLEPGAQTTSPPSNSTLPEGSPGRQADPVRQLLQDELFRLVQLQQINFMSLMQVVGASFANLQLSHPNTLLPQASVPLVQPSVPVPQPNDPVPQPAITTSQPLPQTNTTPVSDAPTHLPQHNQHPGPEPTTQNPQHPDSRSQNGLTDQQTVTTVVESAVNIQRERTDQNNATPNMREIQPLSIHSEWPGESQTQGRNFSLPSHGLLTTANNPPSISLQAPPSGSSQDPPILIPNMRSAPPIPATGLHLLQLRPPHPALLRPPPIVSVREAWGPHPLHPKVNQYEPSTVRRTEEERRMWAEPTIAPPTPHFSLISHPPTQTFGATTERGRRHESLHLGPAPQRAAPPLALLRFHPPQQPLLLPQIPLSDPARTLAPAPTAVGHFPRLQLLQRDPDPPSPVTRRNTSPLRAPRLIPLEKLMEWAAARQQDTEVKLQLLKTDRLSEGNVPGTTLSKKRQKRREEKKKEEVKVGVTFRPEDSIIPPSELEEEEEPTLKESHAIPLGSFDSMLTGQSLLDKAHATAAELHAFASTQKKPPEIQDACTNTEPASARAITDKAISVHLPVSPTSAPGSGLVEAPAVVPPDIFLNLRFSKDLPAERPESSGPAEQRPDMEAEVRQFINVIDLEDEALLHDLPPRRTSPTRTAPDSPPSSAQLHLLAASVTNSAPSHVPTAEIMTEEPTDSLLGPSLRVSPPAVAQGDSEPSGDPVTVRVLMDVKAQDVEVRSLERTALSRSQVSARLSEMDAQLAALQSIADHMDREFANTRMLVRTVETLSPAVMADDESHFRRPPVTQEVKYSQPALQHTRELTDLEEEDGEDRNAKFLASTPRKVSPLFQRGRQSLCPPAASAESSICQRPPSTTVKPEQAAWDTNEDLAESMVESSGRPVQETLGLSGLSDVADILGDLVRDGAISPTALGLSYSRAAQLDRPEERQRQRTDRMEEERRELRAWMRRKQRERLVEYRKQREGRREMERKPFTPTVTTNPSSKDLTVIKQIKREKDKTLLLEHHTQRAREACSLITDLLTAPLPLPSGTASQHSPGTARSSTRSTYRSRSQSTGRNKSPKGQTGRTRSLSSPGRTVVLQRGGAAGGTGTLRSRLGLHRPACALPGDRMSQVTRRGMITDLRGRTGAKTKSRQNQSKVLSRSPAGHRTVKEQEQREENEEREVVSPWSPPLEVRRLLRTENQDTGQGLVDDNREWMHRLAGREQDILETMSESTGSILSKLDWADIERIVAEEGEGEL